MLKKFVVVVTTLLLAASDASAQSFPSLRDMSCQEVGDYAADMMETRQSSGMEMSDVLAMIPDDYADADWLRDMVADAFAVPDFESWRMVDGATAAFRQRHIEFCSGR